MKYSELPYIETHINGVIMEIRETEERFIFNRICPFLHEKIEVNFDKQTLIDALSEFMTNHPERFKR